jgi:hypothetical protein
MPQIFVTPAPGARVRMPERGSRVMPDTGDWVPRDVHYEHLLACGDIILADPQPVLPTTDDAVETASTPTAGAGRRAPATAASSDPSKEK